MTVIIKRPKRVYPLPDSIRDLDEPHPRIIASRYSRVPTFKVGYVSGDNPTIVKPPRSPSKILSKL